MYKGFNRRQTFIGFFVKGSARVVEPPRVEYKGFKFKYNTLGDICRGFITQARYPLLRNDGSVLFFTKNSLVSIRKKQNLKSKYVNGAVPYQLFRSKFKSLFKSII